MLAAVVVLARVETRFLLGRLGGLKRVAKGFATCSPERAAELRAKSIATRKRKAKERKAAAAEVIPPAVATPLTDLYGTEKFRRAWEKAAERKAIP